MGKLFTGVFERAGYDVVVSGRKTALTNEALAGECDLVIVSVPIRDTVRVIQEIAPLLSNDQVLCDFTSLKMEPVEAMLRSKAQVIGLYPMFGPTVSSLSRQTIIVCPARADPAVLSSLIAIFENEGAECTIATPEAHDRMMAVVQGLTHFVTLTMADTIRRVGIDIKTTQAFTSPVYQMELSVVGRLLSQDQDLYADILQENQFVPEVLDACQDAVSNLTDIVTAGDPDRFWEFFQRNNRHFGDYCRAGAGNNGCPDRMHGEKMTIITLGPEGTFSHELAMRLSYSPLRLVPTIHGVFVAVEWGEGDGIVPIENSEAGGVGATLDGLTRFPVDITREMYMPIHHHLAARVPFEEITVIYAHPQTHEQCSEHLEKWGIPVIHTSSNAASALEAQKNPAAGAIISTSASSLYALPIRMKNIENNPENVTRFVQISKIPNTAGHEQKCSILIDPELDRAGLLDDLLGVFAQKRINLTRIESRPSKRGIGTYVFFLDYAVSSDTSDALAHLKKMTTVKELGCYTKVEVPP